MRLSRAKNKTVILTKGKSMLTNWLWSWLSRLLDLLLSLALVYGAWRLILWLLETKGGLSALKGVYDHFVGRSKAAWEKFRSETDEKPAEGKKKS